MAVVLDRFSKGRHDSRPGQKAGSPLRVLRMPCIYQTALSMHIECSIRQVDATHLPKSSAGGLDDFVL